MSANPNNYIGVNATLVGYAASDARVPAYDKEGTRGVLEVPFAINEGYTKDGEFVQTGTTWYTYSGAGEFAENVLANVHKGDKIRIEDARQEVRTYTDREGNEKLGITLRFGSFTVLESSGSSVDDADRPF